MPSGVRFKTLFFCDGERAVDAGSLLAFHPQHPSTGPLAAFERRGQCDLALFIERVSVLRRQLVSGDRQRAELRFIITPVGPDTVTTRRLAAIGRERHVEFAAAARTFPRTRIRTGVGVRSNRTAREEQSNPQNDHRGNSLHHKFSPKKYFLRM